MENLGWQELLLVAIVAILVYGDRLPQTARKIGTKYAELKKKWENIQMDIRREIDSTVSEADIKKDIKEAVSDVNMDTLLIDKEKEANKTPPSSS